MAQEALQTDSPGESGTVHGCDPGSLPGGLSEENARLAEISRTIYGNRAVLRVIDPRRLTLLKHNARYMKKPAFDQLVKNIAGDGYLASVPLCHPKTDGLDFTACPEEDLEVLSGNHRIQGAIRAETFVVLVLVIPHQEQDAKIARQLSHNALVGEDDKQILAGLWSEIKGIEAKLYSGLDSALVAELNKMKFTGFTAEQIRTEHIALWFLPEEVQAIEELLGEYAKVAMVDQVYAAPLSHYQKLFDALAKVKRGKNIKNTAVAFMYLIDRLSEIATADTAVNTEPSTPEQDTQQT